VGRPRNGKSATAYLTIDDAPSADMTGKVDFLVSKSIPAVWFCSGIHLEEYPACALHALKKGHCVANHGYDHPCFSKIGLEEGFEQILRTERIIEKLYVQACVPRKRKYFRFPYGDKGGLRADSFGPYSQAGAARKSTIQQFLRENGFSQPRFGDVTYDYYDAFGLRDDADWSWTYDCVEWSVFVKDHVDGIDTIEKVIRRMDRDEPSSGFGLNSHLSAEIVLTHDHPETTVHFPRVIESLLGKGLQFTLPE
jgi:peptidoglycan/xylan/chitin deacetylase (PgdA/CDA1 family)